MDIGLDEPHVGHIGNVVVAVLGGNIIESALGGDVIVLVEMRLTHDEIGIVNPFHALAAAEVHGVLLYADGSLLQSAVHGGVHRHAVLLRAVVIDTQHLGIVVFHGGAELLLAVLHGQFSVEIDVVMASQVMVHASGERVFLGRAAAQEQQRHHAAHCHDYVGSSKHFVFVL